ncbi:hypothetical protein [Glutamicibacter sp. NPDC087344]|uniref:hypothetical protein n=1 Tax=Glutamicibacter sp. NPDC087344 TaxID=3363994 RepID=UPI00382296E5
MDVEMMSDALPWILDLPAAARESCARELTDAAAAALAHGAPGLAKAELVSWRETAAAPANGLGSSPIEWLDEATPVD